MFQQDNIRERFLRLVYNSGVVSDVFSLYLFSTLLASKYVQPKTIFDYDWDLLVVLDACRVDALREVACEYEFITDVDAKWSVGSTSKEWIINTYTEQYSDVINDTALVSGNGWTDSVLVDEPDFSRWTGTKNSRFHESRLFAKALHRPLVDADDFDRYVPVAPAKDSHEFGAAPLAETVTEAAVETGREGDHSRMIVHYLQPHAPYLSRAVERGLITEIELHPLESLREGRETKDRIWELYLENLRYVLDSVQVLLKNVDADTAVITADHGELFGELGIYGHLGGIPHPALRRVPWMETSAVDGRELDADVLDRLTESPMEETQERLKELGYL